MKKLKKVSREILKAIQGGYGSPVSDGMGGGGWYCPNRNEAICLNSCIPICMSATQCNLSSCI